MNTAGAVLVRRLGGLVTAALDLVYPRACAACGARLTNEVCLCGRCMDALVRIGPYACRRCGEPIGPHASGPLACRRCRREPPRFISAAVAVFRYEGPAREIVRRVKYSGDLSPVHWMGCELAARLRGTDWLSEVDLVTSVPLHWRRRIRRRFNQAELIAKEVSRLTGIEDAPRILRRRRDTPSQTSLSLSQRAENVRGAFQVRRPEYVSGRNVLLVDDVMTTCSTMSECARALVRAGARKVFAGVFAR